MNKRHGTPRVAHPLKLPGGLCRLNHSLVHFAYHRLTKAFLNLLHDTLGIEIPLCFEAVTHMGMNLHKPTRSW